jgi:hypothetical protein
VKKNALLTAAFILVLLFSGVAGTQFVNVGKANPQIYYESVSPPEDAKPPNISIIPAENNTVYASKSVSLNISVSIPESMWNQYSLDLNEVRYQMDWKESAATLYHYRVGSGLFITDFSKNVTLTDIPEGYHNITFIAQGYGGYCEGFTGKYFYVASSTMIRFSVDTISPRVSILSLKDGTFKTAEIPLNFTVSEQASKISYVLDGQKNKTISGNTTLLNLPVGVHNVTVYAWDAAGNIGSSETVIFTTVLAETFPVMPIIAVAAVFAAIVGIGLLVYFKKRKH